MDARLWLRRSGTLLQPLNWSKTWKCLLRKYGLFPHVIFNFKVLSAEWDNTEQMYHITIQDVLSRAISVTNAEVVVSAIGILEVPRYPLSLKGISDYKWELFHSARWNRALDLHGKRVAVIGNGCSAYVTYLILWICWVSIKFCYAALSSYPSSPRIRLSKWHHHGIYQA